MDMIVLITGASSGIGAGIARELGRAGATLMLGARRTDRLDELAEEIRSFGGRVATRRLDVTDRDDVAAFAQAARLGSYTQAAESLQVTQGAISRAIARLLLSYPGCGLRPIGFIDDEARPDNVVDEFVAQAGYDPSSGLPTLGTLDAWHGEGGAEVIVVPDETILPQDPAALYRLHAKQVLVVTRLGEFPTFGLQVRNAGRFVAIELNGEPGAYSEQLKRVIDVSVALALLIPAAPLIALLALSIKLTDPGPVFYGQWRVGQFGKPIRILKLRTMYKDAEERLERVLASSPDLREQWQRHFKLDQDPRILPHVGTLMRRASLDELPQLWNVVRGDMSLVGPRPFPAYHMDAFDAEFRALRASVPPGLTGLWQISSRSNGDLAVQRAEDSLYVKNRSLWLDLYILIATLPAVIGATGAK